MHPIPTLVEQLAMALRARGQMMATAESCTGGLIAGLLTEIAGSSDVVERGFVTYSNEAKSELVGVPAELIGRVGAVSEEVARAMAEGAVARAKVDLAVSVTGIAEACASVTTSMRTHAPSPRRSSGCSKRGSAVRTGSRWDPTATPA